MTAHGFYEIAHVGDATRLFARIGVSVRVLCASAESGLDFRVHAATRLERVAQRRAYYALGAELGCIQAIGGRPRLAAPCYVPDPANLADDKLVQPAVGLGYLSDGSNPNPQCLGMTMRGIDMAASCHVFADTPATWWAYIATRMGQPFVLTGVLLCAWREMPRHLVQRQVSLIRQQVRSAGLRFDVANLWVWVSPGGRNEGIGPDGSKEGFSISTPDMHRLYAAGPDFEEFIMPDAGISDELPHGLDVVGLTLSQLLAAGIPEDHIGGLYEDTVTTRTADGNAYRWGSEQREGPGFASSVIAGTVNRLH